MTSGFGLLEILTSLFILAISMLALTNGLLNAQQHSTESLWLAHAHQQSENIYERMLSNLIGKKQGAYFQQPSSLNPCYICSPWQQAEKDLAEWQQQIKKNIVDAYGNMVPLSKIQKITIQWPPLWSKETEKLSEWILYAD